MQASRRPRDDDGYRLWLRYEPLANPERVSEYRAAFGRVLFDAGSPTLCAAQRELIQGLEGLLVQPIESVDELDARGTLVIGTPESSRWIASLDLGSELERSGAEGFVITERRIDGKACTVLAANTDVGILYGVFRLLHKLQTERSLGELVTHSAPRLRYRMLDHWDNLDGTIERGYAGFSLWDWHKLPDYAAPRYEDYARACASLGLNGAVLTNVNANALVLTEPYLEKVAALANVFRPYGIKVFLTARFSAPVEIGGLATADPLDGGVVRWWRQKASQIYERVPDFGGFLVKANSEGQPGPHDYGRSHAQGANLLADAVAEHGGIVIWRAFVYDKDVPDDRARQAYDELVPLDGDFRENVALQVKNGPIDFQPREPFHPLFGAMPKTALFAEFQVTQEYLGCATHLCYLGPLFKETLDADTHAKGPGSLVSKVVDGSLEGHSLTGMAGVSNIGSDRNWCGHPFAAANWFALGRLAWDPSSSPESIAEEWLRMTFSNDERFVEPAVFMMMGSREAVVDYMTPLGLHHLMARDHHYGPGPWVTGGRADWTSVYYHRADEHGVGFDRTAAGSNAVSCYFGPVAKGFSERGSCPTRLLLWFHHVGWTEQLKSGNSLWEELCLHYETGVNAVLELRKTWEDLAQWVDRARHEHVTALFRIQEKEAKWWRDACVQYFQTFSQLPLPRAYPKPEKTLNELMSIEHHHVPGI